MGIRTKFAGAHATPTGILVDKHIRAYTRMYPSINAFPSLHIYIHIYASANNTHELCSYAFVLEYEVLNV